LFASSSARDTPAEPRGAARQARADFRTAPSVRIGDEAIAYERGTELNEGLAQHVEYRAIGKAPALTADDFPAERVRHRGYATGQAWAVLLDRLDPGWQAALDRSVDEALRTKLANVRCPEESPNLADESARAQCDVADLVKGRAVRQSEFQDAPGWRLEIVATEEPLWLRTFEPLNVVNLGANRVHTRWLKLGNAGGSLEVPPLVNTPQR
jgi:hypothetical protein